MLCKNGLYIYKNEVHGEGSPDRVRILYQTLCTGNAVSYTTKHINQIFEEDINTDNLQPRILAMLRYLQECYHTQQYTGLPGQYNRAASEYPKKYEALLDHLSEKALEKIREIGETQHTPEGQTGLEFIEKFKKDRINRLFTVIKHQTHLHPSHDVA